MPTPARKKRLSLAQMFTLGLATFGGAKANNKRVVPYAHGNRKSTGLATTNNYKKFINNRLPFSRNLAVKTQFKELSNNSKRERNFNTSNLIFPDPTNNNEPKTKTNFKPTPRNTLMNVKRRLGIIGSTKGKAKNVLNSLSNKNIYTQTVTHIKNSGKNKNVQQLKNEEKQKLKQLQDKKNKENRNLVNQKRKNLQVNVNRITSMLPRLQSSNQNIQKMINSSSLQISTTFTKNEVACIEDILVLPSIENITALANVLNDENIPLTRNAILALGGIQENIKTVQINYNKAQRNINKARSISNSNMKTHKNSSQNKIYTKMSNAVKGSLDSVEQAKISKDHLKLTRKDIEIYHHILNETLTNKIKKAYLYTGAIYPNKNNNSLLISIFYSYLRDSIPSSYPVLKDKINKLLWVHIIALPKDKYFIPNVFYILFKASYKTGTLPLVILALLPKKIKIVTLSLIIVITAILLSNASPTAIVEQIVSMAEVLKVYQ